MGKKPNKFLKAVCVILFVILFLTGTLIVSNIVCGSLAINYAKSVAPVEQTGVLVPEKDAETGYWTFTTDEDFEILQLTDVHIGGGFASFAKDKKAIDAVTALVHHTKPDLIIVTGDNVYPVPIQSGTVNNMRSTKIFAELMQSLGVYWTLTFGNHDTEVYSLYSREQLSNYYGGLDYCLYEAGPPGIDGYGNHIINVESSVRIITQSLIMIDSHAYRKGFLRDYDNIHANQIEWYEDEVERLDAINRTRGASDRIKSLAFFHIPLRENLYAWNEYVENGFADTQNVVFHYGEAGESGKIVYSSDYDDEVFETMLRLESTQGIFTGHDHLNNFSLDYNGGSGSKYIRLTYGMSIDYLAYPGISKKTKQRGATVITVSPDGRFDCYGLRLDGFVKI